MSTITGLSTTPPPHYRSISGTSSGSSSGSSTSSIGKGSPEKSSLELHSDVHTSSLASIDSEKQITALTKPQADPLTEAAQNFCNIIAAEQKKLALTTQNQRNAFKAIDGAQVLTRIIKHDPFRLLLQEEEKLNLDLNFEKQLEQMIVQAAELNIKKPDRIWSLVDTILNQTRTILPVSFRIQPKQGSTARGGFLSCFSRSKADNHQEIIINFAINVDSVSYPDRFFSNVWSFKLSKTSSESIKNYDSMRGLIARVTSLANCLQLVIDGQDFTDETNNTSAGVTCFLQCLSRDYNLVQRIGFYDEERLLIKQASDLPIQNGAVQTRFLSKIEVQKVETKFGIISKGVWHRPGDSGYTGMGHTSSYDTELSYGYYDDVVIQCKDGFDFRPTKHNPVKNNISFLMLQDALSALTKSEKHSDYLKIVAVRSPYSFKGATCV